MRLPLLLLLFVCFFAQGQNSTFFYATMDANNAREMQRDFPNDIEILSIKRNVAAVHLSEDAAHILHDKILTHGPGFVFKSSKEKALADLELHYKKSERNRTPFTITETEIVLQALELVISENIENHILTLEAYGSRFHTFASATQAVLDLKTKWETMIADAGRTDITVQLYEHINTPMPSLILTIAGSENPDEFVIIGSHIDSISTPLEDAPGADDNASGVATITEALRVLLEMEFVPQRTIEIMAYAAEEIGLVGSAEIAEYYSTLDVNVIGYVNFDMTNFNGSALDIYISLDTYTSPNLNDFLIALLDHYNSTGPHALTYDFTLCNYGCSDHYSWALQGFEAAFPFEASFGQHNQNLHTPNDLFSISGDAVHATKFAKLALQFLIEAAKTQSVASIYKPTLDKVSVYIQNNHLNYQLIKDNLNIKALSIYDTNGKQLIRKTNQLKNSGTLSIENLASGAYIVIFEFEEQLQQSKKFVKL